jgi:hypothetical protein
LGSAKRSTPASIKNNGQFSVLKITPGNTVSAMKAPPVSENIRADMFLNPLNAQAKKPAAIQVIQKMGQKEINLRTAPSAESPPNWNTFQMVPATINDIAKKNRLLPVDLISRLIFFKTSEAMNPQN